MSATVTEWYPPEIMPVRNGWYERDYGDYILKDYFDGRFFSRGYGYLNTLLPWRGLTEKPK